MTNIITVSNRAVERIRTIFADNPGQEYIRVGIKGGGCSGFSYTFEIDGRGPTKFDYLIEESSVKLIIDKKSAIFLSGTELDYESTIMKSGFVFKNPNAKSTCGCGSSFAG